MPLPDPSILLTSLVPTPQPGYQNTLIQTDDGNPLKSIASSVPSTGGVSLQAGDYAIQTSDCGLVIVYTGSTAATFTLPSPPPLLNIPNSGATISQWQIGVLNIGTGILTLSPNGLNINGATGNITFAPSASATISTDGSANYYLSGGLGTSGGGGAVAAGQIYGQVPRGVVNNSNLNYTLDYNIAGLYPDLKRNGTSEIPPYDGAGLNTNPGYQFTLGSNLLSFTKPPLTTDWLYIWYIVGAPAGPPPTVSAATVYVWTAYSGGTAPHGFATSKFNYPSSGGSDQIYAINTFFSLQQNSLALTLPSSPTIESFAGASVTFYILGSVLSTTDPNYLSIYDAYILFTLPGGETITVRPTSWSFYGGDAGGSGSGVDVYSWAANTAYTSGVQVVDSNGNLQQATNTFSSAATPPVWATSGDTTETTGLIWSYVGPQSSASGIVTNPTLAYDADTDPPATCAVFTQYVWGGLVNDGYLQLNF